MAELPTDIKAHLDQVFADLQDEKKRQKCVTEYLGLFRELVSTPLANLTEIWPNSYLHASPFRHFSLVVSPSSRSSPQLGS